MAKQLLSSYTNPNKRRLHVDIEKDVISTLVNELRGELKGALENAVEDDWVEFHLDLRSCRMIDSMGLNWLFTEINLLKHKGKKVIVRISSPAINRIMLFAGFDKLVILKYRRRKQTR